MLLDVWGVLHDGWAPYPGAPGGLAALLSSGRPVVLLTNTSYTQGRVRRDLITLGFDPSGLRGIVTAGETTRVLIADHARRLGPRFWFICRPEHAPLLEGLGVQPLDGPDDAGFIVVADGQVDRRKLERAAAMGLPMICTNPDLQVIRQDGSIYRTAGAVADDYAALGGTVLAAGKPHPAIFEVALQRLGPAARPVLIGDSPRTDLAGARHAGIDALWLQRPPAPPALLAAAVAQEPAGWVHDFVW